MGRNHLFGSPEKYGIFLETDLETSGTPVTCASVRPGSSILGRRRWQECSDSPAPNHPGSMTGSLCVNVCFQNRAVKDGNGMEHVFFRRCLTRPLWSNVVNSANVATL